MDQTSKLNLPFIMPNQASKHVTLNEGLKRLDIIVQLSVVSAVLSVEPDTPASGTSFILPEAASGAYWTGHPAGTIATFDDSTWSFTTPQDGWRAWDGNTGQLLVYTDGIWRALEVGGPGSINVEQNFRLGINTSPDNHNRLSVKSDAELLSHDDVTPGSGDARKIINKAALSRSASVIFQTAFKGFAEVGLTGDNDLRLRVGGETGDTFSDAAIFDHATGTAKFPAGMAHASTNAPVALPLFVTGDAGFRSIYRINVPRAPNPRQYSLAAISGETVILSESKTNEIFLNSEMEGLSLLRIWNVSRSPASSAWVRRAAGPDRLNITNPTDLIGWRQGDTIQVGDPTDVTPGRCIALDISPMLDLTFGKVFLQQGLLAKVTAVGNGGQAGLDVSPSGKSGSFQNVRSLTNGSIVSSQVTIPCFTASDISNSNLVFVRENAIGGLCGVSLLTANIVYA